MVLSTPRAEQDAPVGQLAPTVASKKARRPAERRRTCIMVLGMHRSGTSAFSRVASLLGCALPKDLMAPSEGNMIGHWESNVITTLNDELLESAGSRWDDWLPLNEDWNNSALRDEFLDRAIKVIQQEYGQSALFVLKDPRICRIAPLWMEALEASKVRTVVAMPIRNPIEVAESLAARDGSAPGHGLLVWLRNVLDAEFACRELPRHVFSYESLLNDWSTVAEQLEIKTGILWPRKTVLTAAEIDAFLLPEARHQRFENRVALSPRTPIWVKETFAILARWCELGEDKQDYASLDKIRHDLNAASPTFAQMITQGTVRGEGVGEAGRRRRQLEEQVTQLSEALSQAEERAEAASQALTAAVGDAESARRNCDELERVLADTAADRDHNVALQNSVANELALLAKEAEAARKACSELELALAGTAADRDHHVALELAATEERTRIEAELGRVADELRNRQDQLARVAEAAALAEKEVDDLRRQLAESIEQLSAKSRNLAEMEDARDRELQRFEEENSQLRRQLDETVEQISTQSRSLAELENARSLETRRFEQEIARLHQEVEEATQQLSTQARTLAEMDEASSSERQALEEEVSRLREQVDQAAEHLLADSRQHAELEHARSVEKEQLEEQISALQEQLDRVAEQLIAGSHQLTELENARSFEKRQLEDEIDRLRQGTESLRSELAATSQLVTTRDRELSQMRELADETIVELRNRLSESESALLQRQEEARQHWAEVTVERRTNELLRVELDRARVRQDVLEERTAELDRLLREKADAAFAAEVRFMESGWAAKEAAIREAQVKELLQRQQADLEQLQLEQQQAQDRLARNEIELAKLVGLQLELETSLRAAIERADAAERMVAAAPRQVPAEIDLTIEQERRDALTRVGQRQQEEIAQLTGIIAQEAERYHSLKGGAEWLRDFADMQRRAPRWWAFLPKKSRTRRLRARMEAAGLFNGSVYLSKYPDVAQSGMDPLVHYSRHGIFEGRFW